MGLEGCRVAVQVAEWIPQGRRRQDKPVNTWQDRIREDAARMQKVSIGSSGGKKYTSLG
jgi:hypothetical protein